MIEGRMNGVAEAQYGQSMYGTGYPMNPSAPFFFKEAHALYGRQLPPKIEVTSNAPYQPFVAASDHQTPINLVAKDMPPETNGYAATFSHRNVGASPYANIFPYHPSSMMASPYMSHQQVHFTSHRSHYTSATSTISIPISRPATESSPVEARTSQASVNGENHDFKKPDENRYHQKNRPKKRQIHALTPAPTVVPTTGISQFVAPPVGEHSPQPPPAVPQSRPQLQPQPQPPLPPILNDDITWHSIDRYGAHHFVQCGSEQTANLNADEFKAMMERGEFVPMGQMTLEDWQRYARKRGENIIRRTIKRITEMESGRVQYLLMNNSQKDQKEEGVLEAEAERPLFVCGRGWTSYSPDRSREVCNGIQCSKIKEGDVVLTFNDKRTIENSIKKQRRSQKQTDLKKNHTSNYNDFANGTPAAAKKLKKPIDEVLAPVADHVPLKKHWFQKCHDLSENHIDDSYDEFGNNAAVAANRSAPKRSAENDSNNNKNASAAAKSKRSQEEASKTRRWSDSCLEKPC